MSTMVRYSEPITATIPAHSNEAGKTFAILQSRLRGGRKDDGRPVTGRKFIQQIDERGSHVERKTLSFVENNNAAGQVMQLAASRWLVG